MRISGGAKELRGIGTRWADSENAPTSGVHVKQESAALLAEARNGEWHRIASDRRDIKHVESQPIEPNLLRKTGTSEDQQRYFAATKRGRQGGKREAAYQISRSDGERYRKLRPGTATGRESYQQGASNAGRQYDSSRCGRSREGYEGRRDDAQKSACRTMAGRSDSPKNGAVGHVEGEVRKFVFWGAGFAALQSTSPHSTVCRPYWWRAKRKRDLPSRRCRFRVSDRLVDGRGEKEYQRPQDLPVGLNRGHKADRSTATSSIPFTIDMEAQQDCIGRPPDFGGDSNVANSQIRERWG